MSWPTWESIDETLRRIAAGARAVSAAVPRVLDDPRAYPREAMLLAAMVGLVVLLAVLAAVSVADAVRTRRARGALRVHRRGSALVWRALTTLVVIAMFVIGVLILPALPGAGSACGGCHSVRPAIEAWKRDVHSGVACYGCHAAPGPSGIARASLTGIGQRLSGTSARHPAVFESACLSCHQRLTRVIVGSAIRVRHREIAESGMRCVDCHPSVGHSSLSPAKRSFERSRMSLCLTCHDGTTASAACETCHVEGPLDNATKPSGARAVATGSCRDCHSEATTRICIDCHGLELPHPVAFKRSHAAMSAADPALCAKCHEGASASDSCACHVSDVNIHGTYGQWFPIHGARAAASGPGGCLCHDTGGFSSCAACHDTNPWQ